MFSRRLRFSGSPLARTVTICLLIVAGSLVPSGCSSPEKRYKVLSFFFDGVPNPHAPGVKSGQNVTQTTAQVFTHKPFDEGNCSACHVGGRNAVFRPDVSSVPSTVCIKCHDRVPHEFPVMHGPVATVECLWCHAPHEADNKELLKLTSPRVCVQCHARELLPVQPPEHQMPKVSCLDCHTGHGGQNHGFLRASATTLPTTMGSPSNNGGRS